MNPSDSDTGEARRRIPSYDEIASKEPGWDLVGVKATVVLNEPDALDGDMFPSEQRDQHSMQELAWGLVTQWIGLERDINGITSYSPHFERGMEGVLLEDVAGAARWYRRLAEQAARTLAESDPDVALVTHKLSYLIAWLKTRENILDVKALVDHLSVLRDRATRLEKFGSSLATILYNIRVSNVFPRTMEQNNPNSQEIVNDHFVEVVEPDWAVRRQQLVENIADLAISAAEAQEQLNHTVQRAHAAGVNWSQIARAVGITPQAARRRWDPNAKEKYNEYRRSLSTGSQGQQK
jgi:hypothetical protein